MFLKSKYRKHSSTTRLRLDKDRTSLSQQSKVQKSKEAKAEQRGLVIAYQSKSWSLVL